MVVRVCVCVYVSCNGYFGTKMLDGNRLQFTN